MRRPSHWPDDAIGVVGEDTYCLNARHGCNGVPGVDGDLCDECIETEDRRGRMEEEDYLMARGLGEDGGVDEDGNRVQP